MARRDAVINLRLSESMVDFLAASLDLLQEVQLADEVLIPDAVREAADRLQDVVDGHRGSL